MNLRKLKWILAGAALLTIPVLVGVYGVSIVQASTGSVMVGSIEGPKILTHPGIGKGTIDMQALLAEALGISVEELKAAQQSANEAAMAQLVDEGIISEEQLENARAAVDLRAYLGEASLAAEALGISQADLDAAKEAGKSLSEILDDQGIDGETYRENLAAATQAAIDQAVAGGVITQEQADSLEDAPSFGFGLGRGFGPGRGGFKHGFQEGLDPGDGSGHGRDGFRGGHKFGPPSAPEEDTSNTASA